MKLQDSTEQSRLKAMLPGSMISVCLHALIVVIASTSLRGCNSGPPVEAGGLDFREVGIAVIPDASVDVTDQAVDTPQDADAETPSDSESEVTPQEQVSVPTELPSTAELLGHNTNATNTESSNDDLPELIGPGAPVVSLPSGGGLADLIRPRATPGQGAPGSPTPGPGETAFMNIIGTGQSFVYVIDTSSSMGSGGRLALAKSQLLSSIRQLMPTQTFQVIFYSDWATRMELRRVARQDMYPATEVNVQLAKAEIDRVTPAGGTAHYTPLLHALELNPDVVYFLTDGDQQRLTPTELKALQRANRAGAQIHVVKFSSSGPETREISWLQRLAQQSGGKYTHMVVR